MHERNDTRNIVEADPVVEVDLQVRLSAPGARSPSGPVGRFRPPFGDQHVRVVLGKVEPIAHVGVGEIDAVDHLGELPRQTYGAKFSPLSLTLLLLP